MHRAWHNPIWELVASRHSLRGHRRLIDRTETQARRQSRASLGRDEDATSAGISLDVISYSTAIEAGANGEKGERAFALLQEMQGRGLEPDVISP